jgi:membrane protein implicated in regulation of membrane protease activity
MMAGAEASLAVQPRRFGMSINPPLIWFLIGLGLTLLEFTVPGAILIFFGLGAWITALTTWVGVTHSVAWQILVFALSSVLLLLLLRRRLHGQLRGHAGAEQDLENDLEEFIGHTVEVTAAIRPDHDGRIEYKGASWEARSDHSFEPGDHAVIRRLDGIHVFVVPVDAQSSSGQEASS